VPLAVERGPGVALGHALSEFRTAYAEAYRLKPDTRFLQGLSHLEHLLTGKPGPTVSPQFRDGRWVLQAEAQELGSLPEFPSFGEALKLLEARANALGVKSLGVTEDTRAPRPSPLPLGREALEQLHRLDGEWAQGQRSQATLLQGTRAAVSLSFQLLDETGTADAVPVRALALLALSRATTGQPLLEEQALLAHTLGYTREARQLAEQLPRASLTRAFLLGDEEALFKQSKREKGKGVASYLWLRRMAYLDPDTRQQRLRRAPLAEQYKAEPHVVLARLRLRDFTHDGHMSTLAIPVMLGEVAWAAGDSGQEEPRGARQRGKKTVTALVQRAKGILNSPEVRERGYLPPFEEKLARVGRAEAFFLDAEAEQAFYRGLFYSALYRLGMHELMSRASLPDAEAFHASLVREKPEGSRDFAKWYGGLKDARKGVRVEASLMDSFQGLKSLGAAPLMDTFKELEGLMDWGDPALSTLTRRLAARLDTRPEHRAMLARGAWSALADMSLADKLYRASLEADADPGTASWLAWLDRDFAAMKGLLRSPELNGKTKLFLVEKLLKAGQLSKEEAARELKSLVALWGESWSFTEECVELLESQKDYAQARELVEQWLEWNPKAVGLDRAIPLSVLARLHGREGNPARGWAVLGPALKVGPFRALEQGALLSQAMGDTYHARQLAEQLARSYPGARSMAVQAEVYWLAGEPGRATRSLASSTRSLRAVDWRWEVGTRFAHVFAGRPTREGLDAFTALQKAGIGVIELQALASEVKQAGNPELAFEMQSRLQAPGMQQLEVLVIAYKHLAAWKSEPEAREWLRERVPPQMLEPLSMIAFGEGADVLLWELVPGVERKDEYADFVWLMRLASRLRAGEQDEARLTLLRGRFQEDRPGFYHQVGRYLLGMRTEDEALTLANSPKQQLELPFYLGLRAQAEQRYEDASAWYQAVIERGDPGQGEYRWANNQLQAWKSEGLSLSQRKAQAPEAPRATAPSP
jgi:hypothetical protein